MEWVIGVAVVVAWFVWHGFRTRCPYCGKTGLHAVDRDAEAKQAEHYELKKTLGFLDGLDNLGSSFGTAHSKPGYANRNFRCKDCQHTFNRRSAITWLTTANKVGDDVAIAEYRKVHDEIKANRGKRKNDPAND